MNDNSGILVDNRRKVIASIVQSIVAPATPTKLACIQNL